MNRHSGYDLRAMVTDGVLTKLLRFQMAAGIIPRSFSVEATLAEPLLSSTEQHSVEIELEQPEILCLPGARAELVLRSRFSGRFVSKIDFASWKFGAEANSIDPADSERTEIPITGSFEAIGKVVLLELSQCRQLVLTFSDLTALRAFQIRIPGNNGAFSEVLSASVARFLTVQLRTRIRVEAFGGFAASLPGPLAEFSSCQHGQIAKASFRLSCGGNHHADGTHLLYQAAQNLGLHDDSLVDAQNFTDDQLVVTIGSRIVDQIRSDLWLGSLIPQNYTIEGFPQALGEVRLAYVELTSNADQTIRLRCRFSRRGYFGTLTSELLFVPCVNGGKFSVRMIRWDLHMNHWAAKPTLWIVGYVVYSTVGAMFWKAFNQERRRLAEREAVAFLERQKMELLGTFEWPEAGVRTTVTPDGISLNSQEWIIDAHIAFALMKQ